MDGWGITATVFAAGAFGLALWAEVRRYRSRPTWSWSAALGTQKVNARRHRVALQLMSDQPAYHVTVEGVGLELDGDHHDHARDRDTWPHLGMVAPSHDPMVLYVKADGSAEQPHLLVTWTVPPMRRERFFAQRIPVGPDAPLGPPPYELKPSPIWRRRFTR